MPFGAHNAGRPPGTPNKATAAGREAIAAFVDGNAERLNRLLDKIEFGIVDDNGKCIVPPDPKGAFAAFASVVEYHIPKLARTELAGDPAAPLVLSLEDRREAGKRIALALRMAAPPKDPLA